MAHNICKLHIKIECNQMVPLEDVSVDPRTFMIHSMAEKCNFDLDFYKIGLFLMILEDP